MAGRAAAAAALRARRRAGRRAGGAALTWGRGRRQVRRRAGAAALPGRAEPSPRPRGPGRRAGGIGGRRFLGSAVGLSPAAARALLCEAGGRQAEHRARGWSAAPRPPKPGRRGGLWPKEPRRSPRGRAPFSARPRRPAPVGEESRLAPGGLGRRQARFLGPPAAAVPSGSEGEGGSDPGRAGPPQPRGWVKPRAGSEASGVGLISGGKPCRPKGRLWPWLQQACPVGRWADSAAPPWN